MGTKLSLAAFAIGLLILSCRHLQTQDRPAEVHAIWAHPQHVAKNQSELEQFVRRCKQAHIELIVMLVVLKGPSITWHSQRFKDWIHPRWQGFDMVKSLVKVAHSHGIKVHGWIPSFTNSPDSPVLKEHPEWAMLNPDGGWTTSEKLSGGKDYPIVWMCPARRPGWVDQVILPLIEDLITHTPIDGIHHDYVRYPGDVAPDDYCFCDYCLEDFLRYNHLYYEGFRETIFNPKPKLPKAISNWWQDYTIRPPGWDKMTRRQKAEFILKGSTMRGGPKDMDYLFYEYRCDVITRFVRETYLHARRIRPDIEVSAAVFKNPTLSGRNIGQRWIDFAPWVDIMMPMCYRSHFPGDFQTYLKMLKEYTRFENMWCKDLCDVYIGIADHYIYNEERGVVEDLLRGIKKAQGAKDAKDFLQKNRQRVQELLQMLAGFDGLQGELKRAIDAMQIDRIAQILEVLLRDPPKDFYPAQKLSDAIEAARMGGARGIVIFSAGGITRRKLWPALTATFR